MKDDTILLCGDNVYQLLVPLSACILFKETQYQISLNIVAYKTHNFCFLIIKTTCIEYCTNHACVVPFIPTLVHTFVLIIHSHCSA